MVRKDSQDRRVRADDIQHYRSPTSGKPLSLRVDEQQGDDIITGSLTGAAGEQFQIVRGIPRFCPAENYAESFGLQWNTFATTQLDSQAGWEGHSEKRLFKESGWPREMAGQRILEAGCGMGRFTEVLARTGAEICTFDYSTAIEASARNNAGARNVSFAQADIHAPPFEPESFDRVLCIGVLQHCPSPERAFESLVRFVKPGGHIFIDQYRLFWVSFVVGKYYARLISRHIAPRTLLPLVKLHVGWVYPLTGMLRGIIGNHARKVSWMLAMADYRGVYDIPDADLRQLSVLDTFDMLAPAHDHPRTLAQVRRWFERAGLIDIEVFPAQNGVGARGRKPTRR